MNTRLNQIRAALVCLFLLAVFSSGCSTLGFGGDSADNSGGDPANTAPAADYYYGAFEDVPLPREMTSTKEGYIVYTQGNVKIGLQVYSGRVEIGSLNKAMVDYMSRDGWALYSGSQGPKQTMLVFNKDDRLCVIVNLDGAINTEMRVTVTHKL